MATLCRLCNKPRDMKNRKVCRSCRNHESKLRMRLKDRRSYQLQYLYGITTEEYLRMLIEQNYQCAVCFTHQDNLKKPLHVDHCHKTNIVRGLLCVSCNAALGSLKEDTEIMNSLIKYTMEKCHRYAIS